MQSSPACSVYWNGAVKIGKNLDRLCKFSFLAKLFFNSCVCGAQLSFSSTVIPNRHVFVTHLRVEFPMKTGAIGPMQLPQLISIASLLPGWGVSQMTKHQVYSSCNVLFRLAMASSAIWPRQKTVVSSAYMYTDPAPLFFTWMAFFMLELKDEWLNVVLWDDSQIRKWIVTFSRFCAAVAVVSFFFVGHLCLMWHQSLVWNQNYKDGILLWKKCWS